MKNKKDPEQKDRKAFKYFLTSIGIVAVLAIIMASFILTGWGTDIFSEWRESIIKQVKTEEESLVNEENTIETVIELEKDLPEDEESATGPYLDYKNLTAEDFFPLKIIIPKIDVEKTVYEGHDDDTLKTGPGHITVTPLPGDRGRCTISGHRTLYDAPFQRVDELEDGDLIYLKTSKELTFSFMVTEKVIVNPEDVYILNGTNKRELLLTTCHPKYSAAKRLIVIAELIEVFSFELE